MAGGNIVREDKIRANLQKGKQASNDGCAVAPAGSPDASLTFLQIAVRIDIAIHFTLEARQAAEIAEVCYFGAAK